MVLPKPRSRRRHPRPAVIVTEGLASMVLVTPAEGILIVPVPVIGPPSDRASRDVGYRPLPCRGRFGRGELTSPVARMENPVSRGRSSIRSNSRFKEPEGDDVSFPSARCHRKSCVTARCALLLYEDAEIKWVRR